MAEDEREQDRRGGGSIDFQDYVDARFAGVDRAVDLAQAAAKGEAVPLKQFFEAILDEQRRGMIVAEQEREKAAKALRDELARAIEEGDNNLREHIHQQVEQIRAAFVSADLLEVERIDAVSQRLKMLNESGHSTIGARIDAVERTAEQHVEQLRREREIVTGAQMEAIAKAEAATERRFESVNEFRQTLTDQTSQFIRREVFDARVKELESRITTNADRMNRMAANDEGAAQAKAGLTTTAMAWIAGLGLLATFLSIAVVVILANGAGP